MLGLSTICDGLTEACFLSPERRLIFWGGNQHSSMQVEEELDCSQVSCLTDVEASSAGQRLAEQAHTETKVHEVLGTSWQ